MGFGLCCLFYYVGNKILILISRLVVLESGLGLESGLESSFGGLGLGLGLAS